MLIIFSANFLITFRAMRQVERQALERVEDLIFRSNVREDEEDLLKLKYARSYLKVIHFYLRFLNI